MILLLTLQLSSTLSGDSHHRLSWNSNGCIKQKKLRVAFSRKEEYFLMKFENHYEEINGIKVIGSE
jgi:hypothetical protein